MSVVLEEVVRKLGGASVLGRDVRSQAELALAVPGKSCPRRQGGSAAG